MVVGCGWTSWGYSKSCISYSCSGGCTGVAYVCSGKYIGASYGPMCRGGGAPYGSFDEGGNASCGLLGGGDGDPLVCFSDVGGALSLSLGGCGITKIISFGGGRGAPFEWL